MSDDSAAPAFKVAFGFQRTKTGRLAGEASADVLVADDADERRGGKRGRQPVAELITAIEGDRVERPDGQLASGLAGDEEDSGLVVPLLADRRDWSLAAKKRKKAAAADEEDPGTDQQLTNASPAVLAILAECRNGGGGVSYTGADATSSDATIEVPLQPKEAESEEDSGTEEVKDADYNAVPVESFGLAALRGMGYKGTAADLAKESSQREVRLRPRGLGLGADGPETEANGKQPQAAIGQLDDSTGEQLQWKSGSRCRITAGRDAGHCGTLVSADSNASHWLVTVAQLSDEVKSYPMSILQLINQREFDSGRRLLNTGRVDRYRAQQARRGWLRAGCLVKVCSSGHRLYARRLLIVEELNDGAAGRCVDAAAADDRVDPKSSTELSVDDVESVVPRRRDVRVLIVRGTLAGQQGRTVDDDNKDNGLRSNGRVRVRLRESGDVVTQFLDDVCEYRRPTASR